jgi:hypothetical protein
VDPLAYAAAFVSLADVSGVLTIYGWADPNSFNGTQTATLLNGFTIGVVPEPTGLLLIVLAMIPARSLRARGSCSSSPARSVVAST